MHTFHICNYNHTFTKSIPFLKVFIPLHIKFCGQKGLDMMAFPLRYPNESFYLTAPSCGSDTVSKKLHQSNKTLMKPALCNHCHTF